MTIDTRTARIGRQRHCTAMVALDTVDQIADRIVNLLSHNRRITIAHRYATYTDSPAELAVGLTVDGDPKRWRQDNGAGFHVRLKPGITAGFGFAAYGHDGNTTEAEAWQRFHAAKAEADSWFDRRRDMTWVEIVGGLAADGPARDDRIVIRAWNRDGVCDEKVIGFDYGDDEEGR